MLWAFTKTELCDWKCPFLFLFFQKWRLGVDEMQAVREGDSLSQYIIKINSDVRILQERD